MLTKFTIIAMLVIPSVIAHCQMSWPYPLHSTFNPKTPEAVKDYSMTSPLVTDGIWPCKGFINSPSGSPYMDPTVVWEAGATINYTIVGNATHGGGSCQLSMSYDLGQTWNVIYSHVGGCLIDGMTTTVQIPKEAPSGNPLFSWSWFNLQGNREMYQNCAVVTITNGGSGLTGPAPFVANANVNDCHTIENIAVVFPEPGDNVVYGGDYVSTRPTAPAGFTGSNCVAPGASSSDGSSNSSTPISPSLSNSSSSMSTSTPITQISSITPAATPAAASSASSASNAVLPSSVIPVLSNTTLPSKPLVAAKLKCNRSKRSLGGHSPKGNNLGGRNTLVRRHRRANGPLKATRPLVS